MMKWLFGERPRRRRPLTPLPPSPPTDPDDEVTFIHDWNNGCFSRGMFTCWTDTGDFDVSGWDNAREDTENGSTELDWKCLRFDVEDRDEDGTLRYSSAQLSIEDVRQLRDWLSEKLKEVDHA